VCLTVLLNWVVCCNNIPRKSSNAIISMTWRKHYHSVFVIFIIVLNKKPLQRMCTVPAYKMALRLLLYESNGVMKFLFYNELTFSSGVHSVPPFKYFSTVVQLKSGAYRVDGTESRPLVNSNRLLHLSCSDKYSSSSASIIIILFFSKFLASSMAACLVR